MKKPKRRKPKKTKPGVGRSGKARPAKPEHIGHAKPFKPGLID